MNKTKTPYLATFVISLLMAWAFLWFLGDYNMYVGDLYHDGKAWVKIKTTPLDQVLQSLFFAVVFASLETTILWVWQKILKDEPLAEPHP